MNGNWTRLEIKGQVAMLTLDHPPVNSLTLTMRQDIARHLAGLEDGTDVRAVVISGAGKRGFCAGADVKDFGYLEPESAAEYIAESQAAYQSIASFKLPLIAAVHGFCLGGGLELALCCDVIIADPAASLGFPETNLSLFPGNQGLTRALARAPVGVLKDLAFTGRIITAEEAVVTGLVLRISHPGEALAEAVTYARQLAARPPLGIAEAKASLNRACQKILQPLAAEDRIRWAELTGSKDFKECLTAFLAKKTPTIKGH